MADEQEEELQGPELDLSIEDQIAMDEAWDELAKEYSDKKRIEEAQKRTNA